MQYTGERATFQYYILLGGPGQTSNIMRCINISGISCIGIVSTRKFMHESAGFCQWCENKQIWNVCMCSPCSTYRVASAFLCVLPTCIHKWTQYPAFDVILFPYTLGHTPQFPKKTTIINIDLSPPLHPVSVHVLDDPETSEQLTINLIDFTFLFIPECIFIFFLSKIAAVRSCLNVHIRFHRTLRSMQTESKGSKYCDCWLVIMICFLIFSLYTKIDDMEKKKQYTQSTRRHKHDCIKLALQNRTNGAAEKKQNHNGNWYVSLCFNINSSEIFRLLNFEWANEQKIKKKNSPSSSIGTEHTELIFIDLYRQIYRYYYRVAYMAVACAHIYT